MTHAGVVVSLREGAADDRSRFAAGPGAGRYPGYHAMAVAALTGHGDPDVVAFTVAEFIPRQVISLRQLLTGFPLISGR